MAAKRKELLEVRVLCILITRSAHFIFGDDESNINQVAEHPRC